MKDILAKEWLAASYLDLESIKYIIKEDHLTTIVAFHSQQSIEKALKTILVLNGVDIPRIHSLNKLFDLVKEDVQHKCINTVNLLDSLYIESRYPGDLDLLPHGKPTLKDAKEFYDFAQVVFEQVCKLLNIKPSDLIQ